MRIIWSINGVLILLLLIALAILVVSELWKGIFRGSYRGETVIVGSKIDEAKTDSLILQGVELGSADEVAISHVFIMPVQVNTFDEPVKSKDFNYGDRSTLKIDRSGSTINYIFLDRNMVPTHTLLDTKAFIRECRYPDTSERDTVMHNILYEISLADSNGDGTISESDDSDLYISDLYGKNLTKITSDVDVSSYRFINRNEVWIRYKNREDLGKEYVRERFAKYDISEKRLADIGQFQDVVKKLEGILNR